ncbi:hypothetical protein EOM81_12785 [bacterium]|nr:hypothetical protein [bacterium]
MSDKKYMVAAGKSITSKKGVIGEYNEISVKTLGSASIFEQLKKAGAIVELSARPEKVNTVNLRPNKPVIKTNDRTLPEPAKAEVKKVEVIEPIRKKVEKKEEPKKDLFSDDDVEEIKLDELE